MSATGCQLPHRVVVLTGPLSGGKTTVRDKLVSLLERLGHQTQTIHHLHDLYAPLAAQRGTPISSAMPRDQITSIISNIYAEHGRDVGTSLLFDFLRKRSADPIYIVDSKRNPDGLRALRSGLAHVAIIGVYAPVSLRLSRVATRQKEMDLGSTSTYGTAEEQLRRDAVLFDTDAALAEADAIVENDCTLPFRLEMLLLQALQQTSLIAPLGTPYTPVQPLRKALSPKDIPSLTRASYRQALDDFAALTNEHNVVVIQGGNRFAAHYLKSHHGLDAAEMKLSSLSKQHPSILLSTMLTPFERTKTIDRASGASLCDLLRSLPAPSLPFTTRTNNDLRVKRNFRELHARFDSEQPLDSIELRASNELQSTALYRHLARDDRPIAFLDDMLYRGRTLHAVWYTLRLLKLLDRPWRFFAVCSDRASQGLRSRFVHVLRPGFGYPFENCARSAQGYYDLTLDRFEYRDLSQLRPVLGSLWPSVVARNPLDTEWRNLLCYTASSIGGRGFEVIASALATIAVHYRTFGPDALLSPSALADQRAAGLGWCPAFLALWDAFISQEWPVRQRERFKKRVRRICLEAQNAMEGNAFQDLADLYREIYPRIWYHSDCLV